MRPIEFRVWINAYRNKYHHQVPGGMIYPGVLSVIEFFAYVKTEIDPVTKDYVLLQYTGEKDFGGKKIYEGDRTQYGVVEFSFGGWNINGDRGLCHFKDLLVNGNIYENPDGKEACVQHCWHESGIVILTFPAQYQEICCHCGAKTCYRVADPRIGTRHGKYRP